MKRGTVLRRRAGAASIAVLLTALALFGVAPASARTGGKLSARLAELAKPSLLSAPRAEQAEKLSLADTGAGSLLRIGDRILVDVRFDRAGLPLGELRAAGAAVINVSGAYRTVTVAVRPGRLREVAGVTGVESVTEVLTPLGSASDGSGPASSSVAECNGAATSEGDTHLRALEARQTFGVDGTGSTVGILSDSFNTDEAAPTDAGDDVASGDLPGAGNPCGRAGPVAVLEDFNYQGDADEGRAMAQIVHDLAPGAKLAFATAFTGELAFATNIERLAKPIAQGGAAADVIVDDVIYFDEPFFQDGPIAVAADNVTSGGVAFFSAAGNDNLIDQTGNDIASWEAPSFRDAPSCPAELGASADRERCMDFQPGAGTDNTFGITVSGGATLTVDLQWAEPRNGVTTDIDVALLDSNGKLLKASGSPVGGFEDNVGASQQPVEVFQWTNSKSTQTVQLVVFRCFGGCNPGASSSTAPRLKSALLQNGGGVTATEYPQSSGGDVVGPTIFGHSGAESVFGVGAVRYNTTSEPEYFSSRGPVAHYFGPVVGSNPASPLTPAQILTKPDFVATDGGANTFFGSLVSGTWRFFGTSAAAPHAAAVAALIRDADASATPAELGSALAATARAVGTFGPEAVGAGLLDAKAAVGEFAAEPPPDETPPDTSITSGPAEGSTINDPTPTLAFSSTETGSTFECRLDGSGAFSSCSSPHTTATLPDGLHTFEVKAKDQAGNLDASAATRSFTVDTQPPASPTLSATNPASPANQNEPLISGAAEAGSTVRLYRAPTASGCTEPNLAATGSAAAFASPGLGVSVTNNSTTTFRATATDAAGNLSSCSSSSISYTEDSQAPDTSITSGPAEGSTINDPTPTFAFSSTETGSTFECRLDGSGAFSSCSSPHTTATLADGLHTFEVKAKDQAGNLDPSAATRSFTVDTEAPDETPPDTSITSGPAEGSTINDPTPSFEFSSTETGSTFECRFDSASFAACSGPGASHTPATALPDGPHTFEVTAKDQAGNIDAIAATRSFIGRHSAATDADRLGAHRPGERRHAHLHLLR